MRRIPRCFFTHIGRSATIPELSMLLFEGLPTELGLSAPLRESTSLTPCYLLGPRERALWAVGKTSLGTMLLYCFRPARRAIYGRQNNPAPSLRSSAPRSPLRPPGHSRRVPPANRRSESYRPLYYASPFTARLAPRLRPCRFAHMQNETVVNAQRRSG
jgi:hypothetical protein